MYHLLTQTHLTEKLYDKHSTLFTTNVIPYLDYTVRESMRQGNIQWWEILFVACFKGNGFTYIYKQCYIIEQRHEYLQTIKQLRKENKTIIYTNETWVNAHHTPVRGVSPS